MATRIVPEPPFAVSLIADLHADNLPPDVAAQLWPLVRRDPESAGVVDALDRVRAELRALGRDHGVASTIPPDVAARLDRALAIEQPVATVHPLPSAYTRSRRRLVLAAVAAAAAATIAGGAVLVATTRDDRPAPTASPAEPSSVELGPELPPGLLLSAVGHNDVSGLLADRTAQTGCLRAAGFDRTVLGSMDVTFDERDAVLFLLAGSGPGRLTALVVGTGCRPEDPQVLARKDIN